MSEYPDHLNPFKESEKKKLGKTLTRSFRELKGFLRQSFRKKNTKSSKDYNFEEVEIRKSHDPQSFNTLRNNVMSLPSPPTYNSYTSPPLPRSRFKERLSRSSLNDTLNSTYDESCNPFAEEGFNPFEDPPIPYRRRRSKKKAPIPPSSSNPEVNYGFKTRGSSKWSLTSSETDYTLDDKSECSVDVTYSHSLRECLDNFNKEMDSLNKGSIEMGGSSPNILAGANTTVLEETKYTTKSADLTRTHSREINNNISEYRNDTDTEETNAPSVILPTNDEENQGQSSHEDYVNGNHSENDEQTDSKTNHFNEKQEGIEREPDVIIYKETEIIESDNKKEEFCINEAKLEFIDQENNSVEQNESENTDSKLPSPIPKLRKIKLDKDVLLGEP
ncbi:uncharacterized protein LOC123685706 isoform X1 [Harmonia axyridis]|uniref:uncharacterized protein LOC123685706 isoform X1 n=2 Tax=Harmonia axyridis TaxID=115357 RepID=UPI001E276DDE|nr:uncharacterized protein LOC123685706 isoform X1 [Harmonia axyridis]